MAGLIKLEITEGIMKGKCFEFRQPVKALGGRSSKCHISLFKDTRLSRQHFVLEIDYPAVTIRDLKSTNGTFVNGTRYGGFSYGKNDEQDKKDPYAEVALNDNDIIKVGKTVLQIKIEEVILCSECGTDIPVDKRQQALVSDDTCLCKNCRRKREKSNQLSRKLNQIRCQVCSRFLPGETNSDNMVNFICRTCQLKSQQAVMHAMRYISTNQPEQPYSQINGFKIDRLLGQSSAGSVYLAYRDKDNTLIAVNIIRIDIPIQKKRGGLIHQYLQNDHIFQSPHIIALNDSKPDTFSFALVMEICSGTFLENFLIRTETTAALS